MDVNDIIFTYGIPALICGLLVVLLGFAIQLYIAYFLYTDANVRGQNGVLWGVIGFFTGLLGLVVWLIMRPEKTT
jgi:predicted cobalt transporter CbtA